jgi:hypothetical protein
VSRFVLFLCAALLLEPRSVMAQSLSGPLGGVFGGGDGGAERDRLDVTAAVSSAIDSEVPPEFRSRARERGPQSGGSSAMLMATAEYEHTRRRMKIAANAHTSARYFQQLDLFSAMGQSVGLGSTVNLPRRATVEVSQTLDYSPSYLFRLFPAVAAPAVGDVLPAAPDYRTDTIKSYAYATKATLAAGNARSNRVSVTAERNRTDFRGINVRPDLNIVSGSAKWSHGIGRTGNVSTEYEYRQGEFGDRGPATDQRITFAADYAPALSVTRRAHFGFGLGVSRLGVAAPVSSDVRPPKQYRVEGDLSASYLFFRSWSLGGSYRRGLQYVAVLQEPVFRDAAGLELSGLVSRRLDLTASAGYVLGQTALSRATDRLASYTGNVRARYGVTRSVAIYGEYLYYHYDLHGQVRLAPDLPQVFEQQGVRLGVMLWARPVGR